VANANLQNQKMQKNQKKAPYEIDRSSPGRTKQRDIRDKIEKILNAKRGAGYNLDHVELYFNNKLLDMQFDSDSELHDYIKDEMNSQLFKYDLDSYIIHLRSKIDTLHDHSKQYLSKIGGDYSSGSDTDVASDMD